MTPATLSKRVTQMQTTYIVTKGQQYDRDGARIKERGARSDRYEQFTSSGGRDAGELLGGDYRDELLAAVARVIESGVEETLVVGEPSAPKAPVAIPVPCAHYNREDGCPMHGETCAPEYSR